MCPVYGEKSVADKIDAGRIMMALEPLKKAADSREKSV
jgi:hypothetical protein